MTNGNSTTKLPRQSREQRISMPKSLKTNTDEKRLLRKFIKERNMLPVFNRYRRIASVKKRVFVVKQDEMSHRVIAYKRGKKVIVLDAFSLRVMATTKKFNMKNVEGALQARTVKTRKFAGKNLVMSSFKLKLREISRTSLTNVVQIDRNSALGKKLGKLFLNITFIGAKGKRIIVEGGSRQLRLLNIENERRKSFDEAFRGALSQINFSYKDFIINWIHFSYFIEKAKPQITMEHGRASRAI